MTTKSTQWSKSSRKISYKIDSFPQSITKAIKNTASAPWLPSGVLAA
jgi:hypothetical protein